VTNAATKTPQHPASDAPDHAPPLRVLAVGDNTREFRELARFTEAEGGVLLTTPDSSRALRILTQERWTLLLVQLDDDTGDRLAWWAEVLRRMSGRPRLVALVPTPSIGLALRATALGVLEVLSTTVDRERYCELLRRVRDAERETTLPLPTARAQSVGGGRLVAESPAMLPVFRAIAQVAPGTASVLILGESGTGKELIAQAIHADSPRTTGPFVAVNCAAIPENLLESELFGHEKGAFTGAVGRKIGRFERATTGTLFLDEIGDMSLALQGKILRAVQEREVERVGGSDPIPVDVRLIAATNGDLPRLIADGRFREDLYYRLAVVTISLPRLAERGDDLLALTAHFLDVFGRQYHKSFTGITDQAVDLLRGHEWAGNVRELRNVVERSVLVADGPVLRAEHLPEEWRTGGGRTAHAEPSPLATMRDVEARHIARVLAHTEGQIGEAARILGVHRNTLARKIRDYGL
jgi:two-component system response regulator HydG